MSEVITNCGEEGHYQKNCPQLSPATQLWRTKNMWKENGLIPELYYFSKPQLPHLQVFQWKLCFHVNY